MGRFKKDADGWVDKLETRTTNLNIAISRTVQYAIRDTTVTEFARRAHLSRVSLSLLFSQKPGTKIDRHWTLESLLAVTDALGVKVSELIAEAERVSEGEEPRLVAPKAAPRTPERLQKLIYCAVGYTGKKMDSLISVMYRVQDIQYGAPGFYNAYMNGEMSDADAMQYLEAAYAKDQDMEEPLPPFWVRVKDVFGS